MVVLRQERCETDPILLPSKVLDERRPARTTDRRLQVLENDLSALPVEIDGAAGRQEWKLVLDLLLNPSAPCVEDRLQPVFETELAMLLADEVDDGQTALVARSAKPTAQLLGEHGRGRRRPKQQHCVDVGHVDAL